MSASLLAPEHPRRAQGRRNLTLEDHLQRFEYARSKFLLCAYTGLRISDAERLATAHIQGNLIKIEAGKMGIMCYIPLRRRRYSAASRTS